MHVIFTSFSYDLRLHCIPVVPARGGAEVALGSYYKTFVIYRTCMRRGPARPLRARFGRTFFTVVVQEQDLRTTTLYMQRHAALRAWKIAHHTALFTLDLTLRTSHPTNNTSHFIWPHPPYLIALLLACPLNCSQPRLLPPFENKK